ncbi:hypothetical protein Pcinc_031976 [Petrolisthes cinctipes]|uniref:Uncharacterized protein n=1 Tax=Petrolisthes cinctipes TaxID=88211 RepID=A0AAE1K1S7_PETCI|nr:hypothetical protein Pcinc_031976 [Petrolisthes cinctipes]
MGVVSECSVESGEWKWCEVSGCGESKSGRFEWTDLTTNPLLAVTGRTERIHKGATTTTTECLQPYIIRVEPSSKLIQGYNNP